MMQQRQWVYEDFGGDLWTETDDVVRWERGFEQALLRELGITVTSVKIDPVRNRFKPESGTIVRCQSNKEGIVLNSFTVPTKSDSDHCKRWPSLPELAPFLGRKVGFVQYSDPKDMEQQLQAYALDGQVFVKTVRKASHGLCEPTSMDVWEALDCDYRLIDGCPNEIIVSQPVRFRKPEYRCFVMNGACVTVSANLDNPLDPEDIGGEEYRCRFFQWAAQEIADAVRLQTFVVDLAYIDSPPSPILYCPDVPTNRGNIGIVELNGLSGSGRYRHNYWGPIICSMEPGVDFDAAMTIEQQMLVQHPCPEGDESI